MKVEVYFNLHKHLFSVRQCPTGKVILHTTGVHLDKPQFVVREAGRQRVLRERKKNVHAFVRGYASYFDDWNPDILDVDVIGYNPYKFDTFVSAHDTSPVRSAKRAVLELMPVGDITSDTHKNVPIIRAEGVQA